MKKELTRVGMIAATLLLISACKEQQSEPDAAKALEGAATEHAAIEHQKAKEAPKSAQLHIMDAKIGATEEASAALYFVAKNTGAEADKLLGASAHNVKSAELHETVMEDAVASMHAIKEVEIPAGKSVAFEHGGKHVMLMGLAAGGLKAGDHVDVILHFQKAGDIHAKAEVVSMPKQ